MATFQAFRIEMESMGFVQDGEEIYEGEFNFIKELDNGNKFVFRMTQGEQLGIYYVPADEPYYRQKPKFLLDNRLPDSIPMGEHFINMGIDFVRKYEKLLRTMGKL